ncbi:hypothetical protein D9619_009405 [Psilocybe cf. subviscida]|uniref:Uncharacterized protein n=1 Tax=Psilocybe cf. subviscida TaxID=2480587 RepID=A0A8H5FAB9_9AGAR|nr:hypothetical protein D9619_009405 [Psilocybe cf. subviscida]
MHWRRFIRPAAALFSWLLGEEHDLSSSSCLQTAVSIEGLVSCLDTYTVPHNYYNAMTYDLAQPVGTQRRDWSTAVQSLLSVDGDCASVRIPLSLRGMYAIETFGAHCVLYETTSRCGTYLKGWGYVIVPARRSSVSRNLHVSAPHPGYDLGTVEQAAAVYEATGAKSLLVTGRTRTAFLKSSACIPPTSPSQDYYTTDPAHNDEEPFFDASMAIRDWQYLTHGGCPSSSCGFLQMHGKGRRTCASVDIFLSSGLGNSPSSKRWYTDDTDRPIKRLQGRLQEQFPERNVSLPADSSCILTATKNVVGRALNGVSTHAVCGMPATPLTASGEFLHAEQASGPRMPGNYQAWARAVRDTFEPSCAEGMVVDKDTKLCIPSNGGRFTSAAFAGSWTNARHLREDLARSWLGILLDPHKWMGVWYYFMSYLTMMQFM